MISHYPFNNRTVFELLHLQNSYFYFVANMSKMSKKCEKSTIKLVLKSFQTYAENIFINIIFPKIDPFVYVSTKHNSHISKNNFLVIETHLKNWNTRKWLTLILHMVAAEK